MLKITPRKAFIIGETALNHQGDFDYLKELIVMAGRLKLSAIKLHVNIDPAGHLTENHPLIELSKKVAFDKKHWSELIGLANRKGLQTVGLANNVKSMRFLAEEYPRVAAVEVHSTGINDYFLLKEAAKFKGSVVLGVGGSRVDEIAYAVDWLKRWNKDDILLMYGFQNFPTDYREINLAKMVKLHELFGLPMGYADHTRFDDPNNEIVSCMGAMMGFAVLEKHLTLDEGTERYDYQAAVGEKKMKRIQKLVELALTVRGSGGLEMSEAEMNYGRVGTMRKAIVARRKINRGRKLSLNDLAFKRTEKESSLAQNQLLDVVGLKAKKSILKDEIVDFSNVNYQFQLKSAADLTGRIKGRK